MVVGQEGALGKYRLGGSARRAPCKGFLEESKQRRVVEQSRFGRNAWGS